MAISSVNVIVPASGDGPIADISTLVGKKTVELTGTFTGRYVILGSLNDVNFVPILEFEARGEESIELSLPIAIKSVRVRAQVTSSSGVSVNVTALSSGGTNNFVTLGTLPPGSSGAQPVLDTYTVFPPTGVETNINYQCTGNFTGLITVKGSMDGVQFNPIGSFRAGPQQPSLLGNVASLEFSPLASDELVRYIQLFIEGTILSTVVITMGGAIITAIAPPGGAGGVMIGTDRESTAGLNEEIIFEAYVDLEFLGATVTPHIEGIGYTSAATGVCVVRMYLGATTPGDTTGGTLIVLASTVSDTPVAFGVTGGAIANPGGRQLLQITLQNPIPLPGLLAYFRGYTGGVS
jgi:hypothetical protein